MNIRKACLSDIKAIKEISDKLIVGADNSEKQFGFYEYSLSLEQYSRRIESSFFLVAESFRGLEGFCLAYDFIFLRDLVQKESKLLEDAVIKYLLEIPSPFVYIDQLGVKEPRTSIGNIAACRLLNLGD